MQHPQGLLEAIALFRELDLAVSFSHTITNVDEKEILERKINKLQNMLIKIKQGYFENIVSSYDIDLLEFAKLCRSSSSAKSGAQDAQERALPQDASGASHSTGLIRDESNASQHHDDEAEKEAAAVIQTTWRRFNCEKIYMQFLVGLVQLQSIVRGSIARRRVVSVRRSHRAAAAALLIQSRVRGFLVRRSAREDNEDNAVVLDDTERKWLNALSSYDTADYSCVDDALKTLDDKISSRNGSNEASFCKTKLPVLRNVVECLKIMFAAWSFDQLKPLVVNYFGLFKPSETAKRCLLTLSVQEKKEQLSCLDIDDDMSMGSILKRLDSSQDKSTDPKSPSDDSSGTLSAAMEAVGAANIKELEASPYVRLCFVQRCFGVMNLGANLIYIRAILFVMSSVLVCDLFKSKEDLALVRDLLQVAGCTSFDIKRSALFDLFRIVIAPSLRQTVDKIRRAAALKVALLAGDKLRKPGRNKKIRGAFTAFCGKTLGGKQISQSSPHYIDWFDDQRKVKRAVDIFYLYVLGKHFEERTTSILGGLNIRIFDAATFIAPSSVTQFGQFIFLLKTYEGSLSAEELQKLREKNISIIAEALKKCEEYREVPFLLEPTSSYRSLFAALFRPMLTRGS